VEDAGQTEHGVDVALVRKREQQHVASTTYAMAGGRAAPALQGHGAWRPPVNGDVKGSWFLLSAGLGFRGLHTRIYTRDRDPVPRCRQGTNEQYHTLQTEPLDRK
jgi:hypothetical protein